MKKILLFILLLPSLASAYNLNVTQGITVYTINGIDLASKSSDNLTLIAGKNQIAIRFDGKLRQQGKTEHFESKPYLITLNIQSDVKMTTISSKYNNIVTLAKQNKPIFKLDTNVLEQKVLPAISKVLPYSNIPALVTHYNEVNGIYFAENGLENLTASEIIKQQDAKESKVVAQLKYWYSKATPEEIAAFETWKTEK
ncbi:DUF2057 family protein [Psychromonas sp. PT13]|uniref:DUF2057 family protein n=1 Tax=Psychromonas sp. PT13 TaxID=3439547 RepID=UPI003EBB71D6